ncbi:hypothetical protein QOT17_003487 [Balamuthia mandrillaris]
MAQMMKSLMILPAIFVMQKIDFEDPTNVFYLRAGFIATQVAQLLVATLLYFLITSRKQQDKVTVPPAALPWGAPTPDTPAEPKEMTVEQYDLSELRKFVQQVLIVSAICGFIHYKWALCPPLFIQAVLAPMAVYNLPLFQLYLLGAVPEGPLQRPFAPEPSPFAALFQQQQEEQPQEQPASATDEQEETSPAAPSDSDSKKKKETKKSQ